MLLLIAILMVIAGIDALVKSFGLSKLPARKRRLNPIHFILIGFVTGFGSAVSGTGGPLILVPIAIYLGVPVLTAVGLSQAIQIPIAAFASIGNWVAGNLNVELALVMAAALVVGTLAGAILIHRLPTEPMRKYIAVLIILVGLGIGIKLMTGTMLMT